MKSMLMGAIAMGSAVIALFFLRYWRSTGDRLFLFFAASFGIEAVNRLYMGIVQTTDEERPLTYLVRLLAYVLILVAILDKNWPRHRPGRVSKPF